jgi:hypothetical protein
MKPSQWLDVIDIGIRLLAIARQLLSELWSGQGNGNDGDRNGRDGDDRDRDNLTVDAP